MLYRSVGVCGGKHITELRNIFIREEEDGYFVTEFPLLLTIGHNITVHFLPVHSFRRYAIELFPSFISLFLSFYFVQMCLCLPRFTNTGDFFSFVPRFRIGSSEKQSIVDRRSSSLSTKTKHHNLLRLDLDLQLLLISQFKTYYLNRFPTHTPS